MGARAYRREKPEIADEGSGLRGPDVNPRLQTPTAYKSLSSRLHIYIYICKIYIYMYIYICNTEIDRSIDR